MIGMESVVKQLSQDIGKLWDAPTRERVERIVQVFLNCRKKNNRMLLLGLHNNSYVVNQLGFSADDFIKDDAKYLINITQSNKDSVTVSFDKLTTPVSLDRRQDIKDLYRCYDQCSVDIDSSIDEGMLPLLKIQHGIDWLILHKHKCLVSLMSECVVDNLTINTKHRGGNGLHSSITELCIIPRDNWILAENSVNFDKNDTVNQTFWDYLSSKHASIDNPKMFNFVVLNSENDHLMRVFSELMSEYKDTYSIRPEYASLMKRVFFIQDRNLLTNSRFFELNNVDPELFKSLENNICSLENIICDIETYSNLLEIVTECKYKFADISPQKLKDITTNYTAELGRIKRSLTDLSQSLSEYPCLYAEMNNDFYTDANDDRDKFYDDLKAALLKRQQFAEKFGRDYLIQINHHLADIDAEKETMCKKKSGIMGLVMPYEIGNKKFQGCVDSWRSKLNSLDKKMISSISITDWRELVQKMEHAKALSPSMELVLSPANRIAVKVEGLKRDYREVLVFVKDEANKISDCVSHKTIVNGEIRRMINDLAGSERLSNSAVLSQIGESVDTAKAQDHLEKYLRGIIRDTLVDLARAGHAAGACTCGGT